MVRVSLTARQLILAIASSQPHLYFAACHFPLLVFLPSSLSPLFLIPPTLSITPSISIPESNPTHQQSNGSPQERSPLRCNSSRRRYRREDDAPTASQDAPGPHPPRRALRPRRARELDIELDALLPNDGDHPRRTRPREQTPRDMVGSRRSDGLEGRRGWTCLDYGL